MSRWGSRAGIAVWAALATLVLAMVAANLQATFAVLQEPCATPECARSLVRLTPDRMLALERFGISPSAYAAYTIGLGMAATAVTWGVAAMLVFRAGGNAMALLLATTLLLSGNHARILPEGIVFGAWEPVDTTLSYLSSVLLVLVFYLFPDGRWVPRWSRWAALVFAASEAIYHFDPSLPEALDRAAHTLDVVVYQGSLVAIVAAQVYRYRRVSSPWQRLQTQWVLFALAITIAGWLAVLLIPALAPHLTTSPVALLPYTAITLVALVLPLALSAAVLRYRLYHVDVLIRRTLVWTLLTAGLVALYASGVIVLQRIFHGIAQNGSDLAVVLSTLAAAAAFRPLQRRLQALVDRAFYRNRYDAQQILAAVGASLRAAVDLEPLIGDLRTGIDRSLQPAHVSIWLRPAAGTTEDASETAARYRRDQEDHGDA